MRRQASRHAAVRPLRFEGLEPRRVLATFTVTNLLDDGPGSLRDAIDQANAAEGADEIDFAVTGVIPLESQLPTITDSVSINGPGRDLLTLDAGGGASPDVAGDGYRHFDLATGINVEIAGLTLTGGDPAGISRIGGSIISRAETLRIADSTLTGNQSRGGGAIANEFGELHIDNSVFSFNSADDEFGGGGVWNGGSLHITGSSFHDNIASGAGGAVNHRGADGRISDSEFVGNAGSFGGGLFNSQGAGLVISNSSFKGNTASEPGGGLANAGVVAVRASAFYENRSEDRGGGIDGIGDLRLSNSTVSANIAANGGGGIGAIGGELVVESSTIIGNTATSGAGGGILGDPTATSFPLTVSVRGSVIAGNTAAIDDEVSSPLLVNAFNFIGGDAMLGPLADNGGPTLTHAPLPGSPLIDAGDPAFDANGPDGLPGTDDDVPFDQRGDGFARVAGGRIDIGAFEVQVAAPLLGDANGDGAVDLLDLDILGSAFGGPVVVVEADFNGDGTVDLLDLDVLGQNWTATTTGFARGEAPLPGDANEDGVVDLLDLDILGRSNSFDLRADFNGDGVVDLLDLDILGQNWGRRALLLLRDGEPTESEDAPTIAARDEALADEAPTELSPSLSGRG